MNKKTFSAAPDALEEMLHWARTQLTSFGLERSQFEKIEPALEQVLKGIIEEADPEEKKERVAIEVRHLVGEAFHIRIVDKGRQYNPQKKNEKKAIEARRLPKEVLHIRIRDRKGTSKSHLAPDFIPEEKADCHAPSLAQTKSGELLCAYFAGAEEGSEDVGIWLSTYAEERWSEPLLIAHDPETPCWNPVLCALPSGELLLFYKVGVHPISWSAVMKRSFDGGKTWSSPENLPAGVIGPAKNSPLLLEDGTLLCGSSTETWHRWGCWIDITSDGGITWSKSRPINLKGNLFGIIQPALFFTPEGKLRLLARPHKKGFIQTALSEDGGNTWSDAVPTDLPNPNSAIDAIRLHDGRILLVYNHSSTKRTPLTVALSEDGGIHWSPFTTLEEGPGEYSYPSVIQTKDGKVHIVYTFDRFQIKHVVLVI